MTQLVSHNVDLVSTYQALRKFAAISYPAEADDLVQDLALRFLRNPESLPRCLVKSWINRVLKHAHIDAVRKKYRGPVDAHWTIDQEGTVVRVADPDMKMLVREGSRRQEEPDIAPAIARALGNLPAVQRQAFELHLDGMSYSEIAEQTNSPVGTVRSRLYWAKQKLRDLLADIV